MLCSYACTQTLRLLNALNSEDRGWKVRFSLATIVFETFELILRQMLSSQGKNAPSNPYPHYLVRLATSRKLTRRYRIFKRGRGYTNLAVVFAPLPPKNATWPNKAEWGVGAYIIFPGSVCVWFLEVYWHGPYARGKDVHLVSYLCNKHFTCSSSRCAFRAGAKHISFEVFSTF